MQDQQNDQPSVSLDIVRQEIDALDAQIVDLLKQRASWVHQVGAIKKSENSPIFVPERETSLFNKLERLNDGVLPEPALQAIYREIISCSFQLEGGLDIAYLGPQGTWSHQAALKQFGKSCNLLPQQNFADIFNLVERKKVNYGIVPIENSTEGSVNAVMDLFMTSPLKICAQIHLNIRNALLGNVKKEDIKIIYSHPQALGQTRNWILKNLPEAELVETSSTTKAALLAKENAHLGAASMGCPLASELFGIDILEEDIQDSAVNTTRFAVIGYQDTVPSEGKNRTSLMIMIHHKPGSLSTVINTFKNHGIDLVRIESRPSKIINWEYVFYIDTDGHHSQSPLKEAIAEIKEHCSVLKIIGSYAEVEAQ